VINFEKSVINLFLQPPQNYMFQGQRKSNIVATRTTESKRVKTAQTRSEAKPTTLYWWLTAPGRGMGVKSFRGLESCNSVTASVVRCPTLLSVALSYFASSQTEAAVSVPHVIWFWLQRLLKFAAKFNFTISILSVGKFWRGRVKSY
jgi:hypothetical protein